MKRLATVFLILIMLLSFASAEELSSYMVKFIADYNVFADTVFNVPHLPMTGWTKVSDTGYKLSMDEMTINCDIGRYMATASITIYEKGMDIDTLSQCACLTAALHGEQTQDQYANLLTAYFRMRMNPEKRITITTSSGTYVMTSEREEYILFFVGKN